MSSISRTLPLDTRRITYDASVPFTVRTNGRVTTTSGQNILLALNLYRKTRCRPIYRLMKSVAVSCALAPYTYGQGRGP